MSHKQINKTNCLSYFGLRKKTYPIRHYHYIKFDAEMPIYDVASWIEANLNGRYYIGSTYEVGEHGFIPRMHVGFEKPTELTYFLLACPYTYTR